MRDREPGADTQLERRSSFRRQAVLDVVQRTGVDGVDVTARRADVDQTAGHHIGEGRGAGDRISLDQFARFQVIDPHFRAGRHEGSIAVATSVLGVRIARIRERRGRGSRLDQRALDRDTEIAGCRGLVVREERDPAGNGVFGKVRVSPLVDVVRDLVAPVLQELRRGPGVIHLIEVHLQRLTEAVDPHR